MEACIDAIGIGVNKPEELETFDVGRVLIQQSEVNCFRFDQSIALVQRFGALKLLLLHLHLLIKSAKKRRNYRASLAGKIWAAGDRRPKVSAKVKLD